MKSLQCIKIIAMILTFDVVPKTLSIAVDTRRIDCESGDTPRLNNIGYSLKGYDIHYGNPVTTTEIVDPGFRSPIFIAEYNGQTTADTRYCTPDGLSMQPCSGNCLFKFDTNMIYGTYSYYKALGFKVGGSLGPIKGASFGGSIGFQHVEDYTESGYNMFTQSEATCCVYTASMYDFLRPKFHPNFIAGLATLTEEYVSDIYRRFIKAFGTHFISKSTMGALYGEQCMIDRESWSDLVSNSFDISLWASVSAMASANLSFNYNKTEVETFQRYTKERLVYSRGALPPADGEISTWEQNTFDEPNVLTITVEPLDTLPIQEYVSASVISNLEKALNEYCPSLVEEGIITSCEEPGPDPPHPKPRVWSHWSNRRDGLDFPIQECAEGQYVEKIQWKYESQIYGLSDFRLKCSGERFWRLPVIGGNHGKWTNIMDCSENGFRLATGREESWAGLVNVRAFCLKTETEINSNDDLRGKYNRDLECRLPGQQIVGLQVRKKTHHGLTNFRVLCA